MDNRIKMELEAIPQNEGFARVAAAAFIAPLNPTLEEIDDVKTAVSEAVTNAIIHGYENDSKAAKKTDNTQKVRLHCAFTGKLLVIEVEDKGVGIPDVEQAMEPLFTTKPDKERSGMGFSFMEAFMDELEVESVPGEGTLIRMQKEIGYTPWIDEEE